MAGKKTQEQDVSLYLQLKSAATPSPALLRELFSSDPDGRLQAVMVCGLKAAPDAFLPVSFGKAARLVGSDRIFYLINTTQDESASILRFLREHETSFAKASLSRCYALPVSTQKIVMEVENNFLDAFVYPEYRIFPYRAPNYDMIAQRESLISELFFAKQFQQIRKIVSDNPTFFRQNDLGVRDAVYLWNRIVLRSKDRVYAQEIPHLELYELVERFADIDEMSQFLFELLSQSP